MEPWVKEVQLAAEEARLVNNEYPMILMSRPETIWRRWPTRTCAIVPGMREDELAQCASILPMLPYLTLRMEK
jgi:hypothetical protein